MRLAPVFFPDQSDLLPLLPVPSVLSAWNRQRFAIPIRFLKTHRKFAVPFPKSPQKNRLPAKIEKFDVLRFLSIQIHFVGVLSTESPFVARRGSLQTHFSLATVFSRPQRAVYMSFQGHVYALV